MTKTVILKFPFILTSPQTGTAHPIFVHDRDDAAEATGPQPAVLLMDGDDQFRFAVAAMPFPQLEVLSQRFPHRDHYNVLPDAFSAGLKALFGKC